MEAKESWIYYLKLSRDLPREYLMIDQEMKKHRKTLVPVTIKALIETTSQNSSAHIIICIRSIPELRYFNRRATKILKYLMRNSFVNLYIASSFSNIGDGSILKRNQYNFMKLPVSKKYFCETVSSMVDTKDMEYFKWPGGRRPRMSLAG